MKVWVSGRDRSIYSNPFNELESLSVKWIDETNFVVYKIFRYRLISFIIYNSIYKSSLIYTSLQYLIIVCLRVLYHSLYFNVFCSK